MSHENFPVFAKDLIEWLDQAFPHKCPSPEQSEREIWMYAGKRELVDLLITKQKLSEQKEDSDNVWEPV